MQVDFLNAALAEHVLDLVARITQHINSAALKEDAAVVLELLHCMYQDLDPRAVYQANEDILLASHTCVVTAFA